MKLAYLHNTVNYEKKFQRLLLKKIFTCLCKCIHEKHFPIGMSAS